MLSTFSPEIAICGVEAGLVLVWELLPSFVRSLYTVCCCFFCAVAQLLGLVFPPLPVFACWWLGSECGITSASR